MSWGNEFSSHCAAHFWGNDCAVIYNSMRNIALLYAKVLLCYWIWIWVSNEIPPKTWRTEKTNKNVNLSSVDSSTKTIHFVLLMVFICHVVDVSSREREFTRFFRIKLSNHNLCLVCFWKTTDTSPSYEIIFVCGFLKRFSMFISLLHLRSEPTLFGCIQHEFDISQNNDTITEKIVRINGKTIVWSNERWCSLFRSL